ncbi:hypothetical protein, partial [Pseudomonas aeruginosa]|uniref:hypothetical protein n=1 Tax=Pseudomonas aeruginosa TaxID=287 RepID=UPI0039699664
WHAFTQLAGQTQNFSIAEGIQVNFLANVSAQIVSTLDEFAQFRDFLLLFQQDVDLIADAFCSHTQSDH